MKKNPKMGGNEATEHHPALSDQPFYASRSAVVIWVA